MNDHDVSTEVPEQIKRPRLSSNEIAYRRVLWKEIKRGPDGEENLGEFARIVAETIVAKYEIMPELLQEYTRRGLYDDLVEILNGPEEE